jgi:hypothetical protein
MNIDLIKSPEPPTPESEESMPFAEIKVEGLTYVPGIDNLLLKELSIEELSQQLRSLSEAGGDAGEPVDVGPIYPYILPMPGLLAAEEVTLLPPVLALRLVIEAIQEKYGASGYQVRLK